MSVTVGRELEGEFEVQEAIEAVETVRHTAALEVAQVLAELIDDTANADAADSVAAALVACAVAAGGQGETMRIGGISRVLPIVAWLPQYNRAWLRSDISAGLLRMGADGAHCHGLRDHQRRSGAVRPLRGSAWADRVRRVHDTESPEAETYPGIAILRFDGGLFFVNADALGDRLRAER